MASLFKLTQVQLKNFRSFELLDLDLNERLTVVYAENGGGKTALLEGIAVLLGAALETSKPTFSDWDVRQEMTAGKLTRVPHFPCTISAEGWVAHRQSKWSRSLMGPGGRTTNADAKAMRKLLRPIWEDTLADWPVLAFYGTQRLWGVGRATDQKAPQPGRRQDGYVDSLDPRSKEKQLRDWLFKVTVSKLQDGAPPEYSAFSHALATALSHPTDGGEFAVKDVAFDVASSEPVLELANGERWPWHELSDGYHVFAGLVSDLARRCVTLNPHRGERAVLEAEGVVLIDEIDLHLHPRWQRVVLRQLLQAFPKLQFIVSTHSPQVLSSVQNDQVVGLSNGKRVIPARVAGKDSNAILREAFDTSDRDQSSLGSALLKKIDGAVEAKEYTAAQSLLLKLREEWGDLDPEVIRLTELLDWAMSK